MVESTAKDWFYDDLKPWVHYVPIKNDFTDILDKIEYLRAHDEDAREIAVNGSKFARFHFQKSEIRKYLLNVMIKYSKHF